MSHNFTRMGYNRVVSVAVTGLQYAALYDMALKNRVTLCAMIRAILVDAIEDEHAIQRREQEGRETSRESREIGGAATP